MRRAVPLIGLLLAALSGFMLARGQALTRPREHPVLRYEVAVGFDFEARVRTGEVYRRSRLGPDDLVRFRLPQEPPAHRHALVARYAEAIDLRVSYRYAADSPQRLSGRLRVRSRLVVPRLWQEDDALRIERAPLSGTTSLAGEETLSLPVGEIMKHLQAVRDEAGINPDQAELRILTEFEVDAPGAPPLHAALAPEYVVVFRGGVLEIDEPRELKEEKVLSRHTSPEGIVLLGTPVTARTWRTFWASAGVSGLLIAAWANKRTRTLPKVGGRGKRLQRRLEKLGPGLVLAAAFEPREEHAVAELSSIEQLIRLHVLTDCPVIRVGNVCYLADGGVCYRLVLRGAETT